MQPREIEEEAIIPNSEIEEEEEMNDIQLEQAIDYYWDDTVEEEQLL